MNRYFVEIRSRIPDPDWMSAVTIAEYDSHLAIRVTETVPCGKVVAFFTRYGYGDLITKAYYDGEGYQKVAYYVVTMWNPRGDAAKFGRKNLEDDAMMYAKTGTAATWTLGSNGFYYTNTGNYITTTSSNTNSTSITQGTPMPIVIHAPSKEQIDHAVAHAVEEAKKEVERARAERDAAVKDKEEYMDTTLNRPAQSPPDTVVVYVRKDGSFINYWDIRSRYHKEFIEAIKANIEPYRDDMIMRQFEPATKAWLVHESQTSILVALLNQHFKKLVMSKEARERIPGFSDKRLDEVRAKQLEEAVSMPSSPTGVTIDPSRFSGGRSVMVDDSVKIDDSLYAKIVDDITEGGTT